MGELEKRHITNFLSKEHGDNLPTVRIKKIILDDFKSVGHGEILFNCGKEFVPYGTSSDILGIYGQNGSGKTSLIEALSIVRGLMTGASVPSIYTDCVAIDKECARVETVFDLQYPDGIIREATYSFCMGVVAKTKEEIIEKYKDAPDDFDIPDDENKIVVYNEKFSLLWEDVAKRQMIIDTSSIDVPFIPTTKRKELAGGGRNTLVTLAVKKQLAKDQSRSFIFMKDTLQLFSSNDIEYIPFKVLAELRYFALYYLHVVDTKSSGFIRLNFATPLFTVNGPIMFDSRKPETIPVVHLNEIKSTIEDISSVLGQLVPGLAIELREISSTTDKKGNPAANVMLYALRDGKELPLRDESDGVRKIISVLSLIIAAFKEQSVTIAIDEFDAGIFEYLLGEILQAMEESGKGQFIFTSHNLRPLEVINKKFLYFTTTNPQNRYIRLKNIAATNNLRDTYFREIVLNEQDEEIYNRTKRFKIVAALKKARGINDGE